MGKRLKIVVGIMAALVVSACDLLPPPGPSCVASNEFGDVSTQTFTIDATQTDWLDTGVNVDNGDQINVDVTGGSLALCGQEEIEINVDATSNNWTPTGIIVRPGDSIVVEVPPPPPGSTGPSAQKYTRWNSGEVADWPGGGACTGSGSSNCWYTEGMGLIAKLGGGTGWGDRGAFTFPGPFDAVGFEDKNGYPVQMKNYSFGGADALELFLIVIDEEIKYDDNRGGYRPKIKHMGCIKNNGENAEFRISGSGSVQSLEGGGWKGGAWSSGRIYMRIVDTVAEGGDADPANNLGDYSGAISTYDVATGVSDVLSMIVEGKVETHTIDGEEYDFRYGGVKTKLEQARELVYRGIITTGFHNIVSGLLILYIAIYGLLFMYGFIQNTQMDFLIRIVKFAVVVQLMQPGSWDFFNTYLFPVFTEGSSFIIHVFASAHLGEVPPYNPDMGANFTFLDSTVGMFFSQSTWIKIAAILFSGPLGWLVVALIVMGMYFYIMGVMAAFILYLISIVALSLLIAIAPIFLVFMLFNKTNDMFKKWISAMLAFALRPVLVFAVLVIFNFFIYAVMLRVFNFEACWGCICRLPPELLNLCIFAFYKPSMNSANCGDFFMSLPVSLLDVAMLIIVAKMTEKVIGYAEKTAAQIAGATGAINLTGMAVSIREEARNKMMDMMGKMGGSMGGKMSNMMKHQTRAGVGDDQSVSGKGLSIGGGGDISGGSASMGMGPTGISNSDVSMGSMGGIKGTMDEQTAQMTKDDGMMEKLQGGIKFMTEDSDKGTSGSSGVGEAAEGAAQGAQAAGSAVGTAGKGAAGAMEGVEAGEEGAVTGAVSAEEGASGLLEGAGAGLDATIVVGDVPGLVAGVALNVAGGVGVAAGGLAEGAAEVAIVGEEVATVAVETGSQVAEEMFDLVGDALKIVGKVEEKVENIFEKVEGEAEKLLGGALNLIQQGAQEINKDMDDAAKN